MNKKQKMEFLLTGELSLHLSKLSNPSFLDSVTQFLVEQGYLKTCEPDTWDKEQIKDMNNQDKAWFLHKTRFMVIKDFNLHIRTGGYGPGSLRASINKSVSYDWVPNNRYWQTVGSELKRWWNVPAYAHFRSSDTYDDLEADFT